MEIKRYICDYCGCDCNNTPELKLPVIITNSYSVMSHGVKVASFDHSTEVQIEQVDICSTCQEKIARLTNLLCYVDMDIEELEKMVYLKPCDNELS